MYRIGHEHDGLKFVARMLSVIARGESAEDFASSEIARMETCEVCGGAGEVAGLPCPYCSEEGVMLGTQMSQSTEDKTAFRIYPGQDISATDLREEIEGCEEEGADYEYGTWEPLDKEGYVETALSGEYLYVWGRLGVVWGGDAQWADAPSVEQGLDWFLNDADEWDRHR
jgi:hypothetical protein